MKNIIRFICISLLCSCHSNPEQTIGASSDTTTQNTETFSQGKSQYFVLLKGKIDVYPVTMYLYKSNGTYSGYYYYDSKQQAIGLGSTGSVLTNKIVLSADSDEDSTETFTLSFHGKTATGSWQMGSKQLPVSLSEADFPLKFDYYSLQDSIKAKVEMPDPPQATAEMASVWPTGNSETDEFVKTQIGKLFDEKEKSRDITAVLRNSAKDFLDDYSSDTTINAKDIKESPESFNYDLTNDCRVVYQSEKLLSLSFDNFSFTGGAHGNYGTSYLPIDLVNRKSLKLTDVIKAGGVRQLRPLLEKSYRKSRNLKPSEGLTEGGLFDNKIEPNENFYITGKGIIFSYQPYEIASYADGEIEIMIDYKDLQTYLQPTFVSLLQ